MTSFWRHPKYNSTTTENDIALIELDDPIEKTKDITYATLAAPKNDPKAGLNVTVAGWYVKPTQYNFLMDTSLIFFSL